MKKIIAYIILSPFIFVALWVLSLIITFVIILWAMEEFEWEISKNEQRKI